MQLVAVLLVVLLNVSMTPLAFGLRSLITDLVVAEEQRRVTAWASYSAFVANILSLWAGSLDLPKMLGASSLTQFQALSIIACLSLTVTITICLRTAQEQNPSLDLREQFLTGCRQEVSISDICPTISFSEHLLTTGR